MSEYLELHALLENLTNRHAFADPTFEPLIDLIARYMLEWENANDPWALTPSTPRDALASLMRDRGTTQVQLEKADGTKHAVTDSCWQTGDQQSNREKAGSVFWSLERCVFVRLENLECKV
jgi:hypothetical protein